MQGTLHHSRGFRLAVIAVVGGLAVACSTYRPLDRGSAVPWAKSGDLRGDVAAIDGSERAAPAPAATLPGDRYVVQPGDRLASLAASFGVTVRQLAEANQLEAPYVIYVSQVLRIPTGGRAAQPARAFAAAGDRYVVQRGETLSSIARRVDVPMKQLAAANRIASPYDVYTGQKLRIPGSDSRSVEVAATSKVSAVRRAGGGAPPPLSGHGFLWPVNGKVVGGFGPTGEGQRRDGIDIAARQGAPVLAAEDGIVAYAGDGIRGYGRLILLRHADGYITTYGHNAALLVESGELVERGQVIARVGSTGQATRSQLHFEVRKGRKPVDPEAVLVREPTAVASTE